MSRIFSVLLYLQLFLVNIIHSERKLDDLSLDFVKTNWNLDSTNGVYYQIGVVYCTKPTNTDYQSLAIYVPKEYLTCTQSGEKYSCEINSSGNKGSYSASNAPIVFPVETPGYSAMKAPTTYSYSTVSEFISKGIIYVYAGCRGRYDDSMNFISGAPWPVTDLKSAIRYLRYNKNLIPGDKDKIYSFGMSGGGAQSCLMGITGNSALFTKYLEANGAAMKYSDGNDIKDNIKGSQCWCPITNLDTADEAYEWNMGQYYSTSTRAEGTFTKLLSDDLAAEYVKYVNAIKLKDPNGKELTLTKTNEGTYYDFLKSVIEESLNNFLSDNKFPYNLTQSSEYARSGEEAEKGDGTGGGMGGEGPGGELPGTRGIGGEGPGEGGMGGGSGDGGMGGGKENSQSYVTYNNISEYIAAKNGNSAWIEYDSSTNKATITSVGDFVKNCKSASKDVGAFDALNRDQGENKLFGTSPDDKVKHFDQNMYNVLNANKEKYAEKSDWNPAYPTDYLSDFDDTDSLGINITTRLNMYNPMYYLIDYYGGKGTSDVADYFRINTGIAQSDTGNVVEMNLYLALLNYGKNVEFTTVWEKQHVEAERTGDATTNFISWIAEIEGNSGGSNNLSNFINISYLVYLLSLILFF